MTLRYPRTVSENQTSLQKQIKRSSTAPFGPVSIGPGQGSLRAYTGTGDTFEILPEGARVKTRGAMSGLTPLLDGIRDKDDNQDNVLGDHREWLIGHNEQLTDHRGRLDGHDTRLNSAEGRLNGHDSTLSSHNTRINTAQTTANNAGSAASTAQSRADSAWTRAGTGITAASTAQSRADSAWSRAGTAISDAAAADEQARTATARANQLRDQIRNWIELARQQNPNLPPNIPA